MNKKGKVRLHWPWWFYSQSRGRKHGKPAKILVKPNCFNGFPSTPAPPTFVVVLFGTRAMFFLADVMEFKLDLNWIIYTYIYSKLQVHVTTATRASWKPSQNHKQHFYTFLSKSDSLARLWFLTSSSIVFACLCHTRLLIFGSGRGGWQEEGQEGPEVSKSHCAIPRLSLILKSSRQGRILLQW